MDRYTDDLKMLRAATKKGRPLSLSFLSGFLSFLAAVAILFTACKPAKMWLFSTKADWEAATGDTRQASRDYGNALALAPTNADLMEKYGDSLEHNGEEASATVLFEKLLAVEGKHMSAVKHLAQENILLKRYDVALAYGKEWVEKEPNNYAAWRARGRALDGLKRWDEANSDYNKSLALNPQSEAALDKEGMEQQERVKHHTFEYLTDVKLENEPNDYDATIRDAVRYCSSIKYPESVAKATRAIQINPKRPDAYLVRAFVHHTYHNFPAAEKDFVTCEKRWKGNEDICVKSMPAGTKSKATDIQENVVPKGNFYDAMAANYMDLNKYGDALAANNRSISLVPDNGKYYFTRVNIMMHLGHTAEANKALLMARKLSTDKPREDDLLSNMFLGGK